VSPVFPHLGVRRPTTYWVDLQRLANRPSESSAVLAVQQPILRPAAGDVLREPNPPVDAQGQRRQRREHGRLLLATGDVGAARGGQRHSRGVGQRGRRVRESRAGEGVESVAQDACADGGGLARQVRV